MLGLIDRYFFALAPVWRIVITLTSIGAIGAAAYILRQLTASGLAAALAMGMVSTYLGGVSALSMYLFFLISAAFISKLSKRIRGIEKIQKKGGRRDCFQVLANGLPALVSIILYRLTGNSLFLIVFSAALGEATADTWGGDIGVLSRDLPVSIITWRPVERGLSGGISLLGCGASLLASALYGIFCYSVFGESLSAALLVTAASFAGSLLDSVLGGSIQVHYEDEETGRLTEHERDEKGRMRRRVRGIRFFNNDAVNFTSNVFTALLTLSAGLILGL